MRQFSPLFFTAAVLTSLLGALEDKAQGQSRTSEIKDEVSYSNDIRPVVNAYCTTCHAGSNPQGEFVLTSYEDVRKHVERGELLKRINDPDSPMPESGLMPVYMRRLFRAWREQGFVNQGTAPATKPRKTRMENYTPPTIVPIDINQRGFELLEYMQGHWIGSMNLMGTDFEWMAFDYRPIAPSHIHGIFEGGSIGNLFTSFFVTDFNGRRTIMARNGGLLNGIYRTSYFVLTQVQYGREWANYRLVDARGGQDIMWMDLTFYGDTLEFTAYTSRFGLTEPRKHMSFQGQRAHPELAAQAAKAVGFPRRVVDFDFSKGLPKPSWSDEHPHTSASYVLERAGTDLVEMGKLAKDPRRIDQIPYLSKLTVKIDRNRAIQGKKLQVYLSRDALTTPTGHFITRGGYVREELLNTLLSFPELGPKDSSFTFTYLHPGDYYLTVVADMDGDGLPSAGDISHSRKRISLAPESHPVVKIRDMNVRN